MLRNKKEHVIRHKQPSVPGNLTTRTTACRMLASWQSRAPSVTEPKSAATEMATLGLHMAAQFNDCTIERAFCNCAQAGLMSGASPVGLALAFAVAAVRCSVEAPPQKALHRAAVACAALRQPQAALYFLDLVCYPSTDSLCLGGFTLWRCSSCCLAHSLDP